MRENQLEEDVARDIAAAKAEFSGRRDHLLAEYEERLNALDSVANDLEEGRLEPKAAQSRVRQLLGERSNATSTVRAGRTRIGMSPQHALHRMANTPSGVRKQSGPSIARTGALISKVVSELDGRLVWAMASARAGDVNAGLRIELGLLIHLRRTLQRYQEELPSDVVLLGSIHEFAESVEEILSDLAEGGQKHLKGLVRYLKALIAEVAAAGGKVSALKQKVQQAQNFAEKGHSAEHFERARKELLAAYSVLRQEFEQRLPLRSPSLLDQLLSL